MAEEQYKRQIARKLWIKDILAGTYIKEEGMKPNYVILADNSRASRVSLMGVVLAVSQEGLPSLTLDDGSGTITVRAFEPSAMLAAISVGDAVIIIGRPRQFGSEMYVLPEIARKLPDLAWLEVRKRELTAVPLPVALQAVQQVAAPNTVSEEVVDDSFAFTESVLGAIRSLDTGTGADIDSVIEQIGAKDAEKTVQFLLQSGDIFEVSPGKLKVLE
jgi:hypothetical protein